MKRQPGFYFYPDDFLGGTMAMTASARGIYMDLLCFQNANGFIPEDPDVLARISRSSREELDAAWPSLAPKFAIAVPSGLANQRMLEQTEEQRAYRAKKSAAGRKGAEKRWSDGITNASANASANGKRHGKPIASSSSSYSSSLSEKTPRKKKPQVSKAANTPQAKLVEWFGECFAFHRQGETYVPAKQDYVHAHWLLENHSRDEIKVRSDRMLMKTTPFWLENASIALLRTKWNGLSASGE